jgi:hypothetical protein
MKSKNKLFVIQLTIESNTSLKTGDFIKLRPDLNLQSDRRDLQHQHSNATSYP